MLIASVVGTGVWFAVDAVSGEELEEPPVMAADESPRSSPTRSPAPPSPSLSPTPTNTQSPSASELITEGVSIQVLNGTMIAGAEQRVAGELGALGFHIAAVQEATERYEATTVFWSRPEWEPAAAALAARFGWEVAEKPVNLSDEVSIHVVVGADEVG